MCHQVLYICVHFFFLLWRKTIHLLVKQCQMILTRESASKKLKGEKQFIFFLYCIPGTFLYDIPIVINESKNNVMIQTIL